MTNNAAINVAMMAVILNSSSSEPEKLAPAEFMGEADFVRLDNHQIVDAGSLAVVHYDDDRLRLHLNGTAETVHLRRGEVEALFERLDQREDFLQLTSDLLCDTDRICMLDLSRNKSRIYLANESIKALLTPEQRDAAIAALEADDEFICSGSKAVRIGAITSTEFSNGRMTLNLFNGDVDLDINAHEAVSLAKKLAERNGFVDLGNGCAINLNTASVIKKSGKAIKLYSGYDSVSFEPANRSIDDVFADIANRKGFEQLSGKGILNIHAARSLTVKKGKVVADFEDGTSFSFKPESSQSESLKEKLRGHDKFVPLTEDLTVNVNMLQWAEPAKKGMTLNFSAGSETVKCSESVRNAAFNALCKHDKFFALPRETDGGVINCRSLLRAEYRKGGWFTTDRLHMVFGNGSGSIPMDERKAKHVVSDIAERRPYIIPDGRGALNARAITIAEANQKHLSYHSGEDWTWYKNENSDSRRALENMLTLTPVIPGEKPAPKAPFDYPNP